MDIVSKSNVTYLSHLDKARLSEYYKESHIGLAVSSSVQLQNKGSIGNTKVFEYMSYGLPVIVNDNLTWRSIIEDDKLGVVLSSINSMFLNRAIDEFLSNLHEWKLMCERAFNVSRSKYNWDLEYSKIIQLCEKILMMT